MKPQPSVTSLLCLSLFGAIPLAFALQAQAEKPATRSLDDWNYQPLYEAGGIRATSLLEAQAVGADGDPVGTIENAILDSENQIVTLIAEVGGMWDSGDRHVSIPWDEVALTREGVRVPVHQDNVEEYDLFDDAYVDDAYLFKGGTQRVTEVEGDVMTGPRIWKLTDLIDDFASLDRETGLGYITDALLTRNGVMQAVIVKSADPEWGPGPYAYPFYSHPDDWNPGAMHYELPYSRQDLRQLPPFDFAQYPSLWD